MRVDGRHGALWMTVLTVLLIVPAYTQLAFPIQEGKLIFHRYTDWNAWDGQLFIFDFKERVIDNISMNWDGIEHTTNAHFSPDGKKIVFMGVPKGMRTRNSWNIYVWNVGTSEQPKELLPGNGLMDQDPKFFPDGVNVAFKHNGDIGIVNIETGVLTTLSHDGMASEKSMEYPTVDGQRILYVEGNEPNSFIYSMDIHSKAVVPHVVTPGVQNYYCIVRNDSTFLYARWESSVTKGDEIYQANMHTGVTAPVAFTIPDADDSDPYPVNDSLVLFCSNRSGGKGGYDLWVGNLRTGEARSLNLFNVNTPKHELGAAYTTNSTPLSVRQERKTAVSSMTLNQNYPNPFNPGTVISYRLGNTTEITVDIYDAIGRRLGTAFRGRQGPGEYRLQIDSRQYGLSSGVYFYRLASEGRQETRSMTLIR